MTRSQRHLRFYRGWDSKPETAYMHGEPSLKTPAQQYAGAQAAGGGTHVPVPPNAPVNTVAPSITGTAQVGQTLTGATGTWTGTPAPTLTRQWLANDVAIVGATGATYVPVVGDVGKTIKLRVTGTNTSGSAQATSAATAAVIAA